MSRGKDRRGMLLALLRGSDEPVAGSQLAAHLGISRQVVVQDIAVLRSGGAPILATSRGYLLPSSPAPTAYRAEVVVRHTREQAREELLTLVDLGVKVIDVAVEHPIYGELRGGLQLASRKDVFEFLEKISANSAHLLSSLTDGLHLHTLEASSPDLLERARQELDRLGFLVASD